MYYISFCIENALLEVVYISTQLTVMQIADKYTGLQYSDSLMTPSKKVTGN